MYLPDNALPQRTTNPFVLSTMVHKIKPLCTSQPRQHPLLPRFIWRTRACRPLWASSHDHVVSLPALSDRSLIDGYGPLMTHLLMGKIDGEPMGILEFLSLETTPYQTWSNNSVNTGLRNSWLGSLPGIRKTSPKWYPPKVKQVREVHYGLHIRMVFKRMDIGPAWASQEFDVSSWKHTWQDLVLSHTSTDPMKLKQNLRKLAEDKGIDGKEQSYNLFVSQVGKNQTRNVDGLPNMVITW